MVGLRRVFMAVTIAAASLGTAGVASLVSATPSGASPPACTDSWTGPTTGTTSWNASSANWSAGFPTNTSVVCISLAGTYTVDLGSSSNATISALEVGGATSGTQTVEIDGSATSSILSVATESYVEGGGVLALDPATNGYAMVDGTGSLDIQSGGTLATNGATTNPAYLRVPITNESGGTVNIQASNTDQDSSTLTTNDGSFGVSTVGSLTLSGGSSFTQAAGSLNVGGLLTQDSGTFTQSGGTQAGGSVVIDGGATLADSAGGSAFDVTGSSSLSGTIPSGQKVTVDGSGTSVELTLGAAVTDDGTLALNPATNGFAMITGTAGSLDIQSGGTLATNGSTTNPAYLRVPITNESGGTVKIGASNTDQDSDTLTTNDGAFTVAGGGGLTLSGGSSFTQAAGSLTVTGTMTQDEGTFTQSGGTQSGGSVVIDGGATLADSAGGSAFDVTGSSTLSGTIPSGQTVTVDGSGTSVELTVSGAVTDDGTLALDPATNGFAMITGTGSLAVGSGGTLSTSGATTNPAYLRVPITNDTGGTVNIAASVTDQDSNTLTTNDGSFNVLTSGSLTLSGGSSFTQAAGSLGVGGAITQQAGTFTQSGGSQSGVPVTIDGGATLADSAGGSGFNVTGSSSLSGTIPSGQTVTVNGSGTSVELTISGTVTDDGILAVAPTTNGFAMITGTGPVDVASGGVLSTRGTTTNPAYLRVPITNQSGGTVTIGASTTDQDSNTLTTNDGTLQVSDGGHLSLSGGSTLTDGSSGVIGVTVDGNTDTTSGISGSGVTVTGSTLSVNTVGSPAVSSTFTPIGGPVTGTFATLSFGPDAYAVTYPAGAVELTTEAPFTLSPTTFSPQENVATGTVQVASIGNANDDSGVYSATVNYGDGSGNQPATVNTNGATGTVDGPSHTYTADGTYTVTATVANTNGTTLTVSESVTVTGPTISGFSKVLITVGKKVTTKISGIGFDSTASVTVSNPQITVVSVSLTKATKKHPMPMIKLRLSASKSASTGPFNVTITQDTGVVTATNAITVVPKT